MTGGSTTFTRNPALGEVHAPDILGYLAVNGVVPSLRYPVPHSGAGVDNGIERWVGVHAAASPQKEVTRLRIANRMRCARKGCTGLVVAFIRRHALQ